VFGFVPCESRLGVGAGGGQFLGERVGARHGQGGAVAEQRHRRGGVDIDEVGYAYQATFEGFLQAEGTAPADGLNQRADLLARTIRRAFESDLATPDSTLRDIAAAATTVLTDLIDTDRAESGIPKG